MGFFSAVKRFFGQKDRPEAGQPEMQPAVAPEQEARPPAPEAPQTEAAAQPEPARPERREGGEPSGEAVRLETPAGATPDAGEAGPETQAGSAPAGAVSAQQEVPEVTESAVAAPAEPEVPEAGEPSAGALAGPDIVETTGLAETVPVGTKVPTAGEPAEDVPAGPKRRQMTGLAETVPVAPETREGESSEIAPAEPGPAQGGKITEAGAEHPVAAQPEAAAGEESPASRFTPEEDALLLRLRQAPPGLTAWLDIVLEGVDEADDVFYARLRFLLRALEAPGSEIEAFVADFSQWLTRMEYSHLDEFRSELQYRLALALDMEDEEDERNRLILRLGQGLAATREQLGRQLDSLFAGHGDLDDAFWEEMEELFIMADLGYEASLELVRRLKERAAREKVTEAGQARQLLQAELGEIFRREPRIRATGRPEVILVMGVNGAGKTTTIGKLACRARLEGKKALVVAADTFRAAAIGQLEVWARRAGADFYAKPEGSDPASVAWEAMDYAAKNGIDVVFVDTAGRLQTRVNLMEELGKVRQVLGRKLPGAPHRSMLVLDATTGQNALSQAKLFREAAGADEIVLTKLDGTAKGGVAIAVALRENLPITFVGLGEKMEDLRPFSGPDFATALLGEKAAKEEQAQ